MIITSSNYDSDIVNRPEIDYKIKDDHTLRLLDLSDYGLDFVEYIDFVQEDCLKDTYTNEDDLINERKITLNLIFQMINAHHNYIFCKDFKDYIKVNYWLNLNFICKNTPLYDSSNFRNKNSIVSERRNYEPKEYPEALKYSFNNFNFIELLLKDNTTILLFKTDDLFSISTRSYVVYYPGEKIRQEVEESYKYESDVIYNYKFGDIKSLVRDILNSKYLNYFRGDLNYDILNGIYKVCDYDRVHNIINFYYGDDICIRGNTKDPDYDPFYDDPYAIHPIR